MKRAQLFLIFLTVSTLSFGQTQDNQSDGLVQQSILNPIGQQFGGQEIFRFKPGLVTQLDVQSPTDSTFTFDDSRWFSIGRLNTGTQSVYGLRFQLPNKALIFGYQDTLNINPRVQWIGAGGDLGNLEFRVADDFMSTNSDLVATMRNDGGTVFAEQNLSSFTDAKVGIFDGNFPNGLKIIQEVDSSNPVSSITVVNNSTSTESFGLNAKTIGNSDRNFGVLASASDASQNIAVYGGASSGGGNFAGFFDGDLSYTGSFFQTSDKNLKENVDELEFALEDLMQLQPKTYEYIKSDKINLSQGKQFGFIAQELEEVFPELVRSIKKPVFDDNNEFKEYFEYKSVNYLGLIAILTASIQELTAEVNELKENKETFVVYEAAFTPEELAKIAQNGYRLEQNYPNPFQGKSTIAYALPEAENDASIMIFDMTGKTIKEFKLKDKQGQVEINSQDFRPGIYLYSLIGNNKEIITKRMIVK